MNSRTSVIIAVFVAVSVVAVPSPVLAQQRGQVIKAAPIFVLPDANRTPLTVAAAGTRLTVLSVGKEWLQIEWSDPQWGRRVGYIRAEFVQFDRQPSAAPVPPTPTIPTPAQVAPGKPAAQEAKPPAARRPDRAFFSFNGLYQGGSKAFTETFTFDQYAETAQVATSYPKLDGPAYDGSGWVRIWRNLAGGAAVSYFTKSGTATVEATIPHPLYLDRDRSISGASSSSRTELAVHIQAACVIPAGRKVLVAIAGGPSIFNVKQSLVTGVTWSESYPYDTAEFTSATSEKFSKTAVGFNVGLDVGFYFSKTVGIGGLVRYATAHVPLGGKSGSLKVDAGGYQVGGGLRIRIPAGAPKTRPAKPPTPPQPKR